MKTIYTVFNGETLTLIERALMGAGLTEREKEKLRRKRVKLFGEFEREWLDLALHSTSMLEAIQGYYSFDFERMRYIIHLPKNVPALEAHVRRVMEDFPFPYDVVHAPALPDKLSYIVVQITELQKYQLQDIASTRGMSVDDYLQVMMANHIAIEVNSVIETGELK